MAVDRVPAGVADTAGEPAPVHAGIGIEHLFGRLHPVDGLRRLAPEAPRVALPAGIDLVIAAPARIHGAAPPSIVLPPPSGCTAMRHSRAWQAVCSVSPPLCGDLQVARGSGDSEFFHARVCR